MTAALRQVTAALPGSEERSGQELMAETIADGLRRGTHVVVQAGTGTGKTLGYLVPAILSGKRVIVATATKALQDQLAGKDLPFLTEHLPRRAGEPPFEWAVLKGRSNYLCLQRLRELTRREGDQLELDGMAPAVKSEIARLTSWSATTRSGDLAELTWQPSEAAQKAVTVGSDECPGATRCPVGAACYAEGARQRAEAAQVTVVNLHLFGLDVAAGGAILPEHDVVVIDEAHQLEDIMSDTIGLQIGPWRFAAVAAGLRRILDDSPRAGGKAGVAGAVAEHAATLREVLGRHLGERFGETLPDDVVTALIDGRASLDEAQSALRAITNETDDVKQRKIRAQQLTTRLQDQIDAAVGTHSGSVAFCSGTAELPRLEVAPLDVGPALKEQVWSRTTAVLTSATVPATIAARVGLGDVATVDAGSPFDYQANSLLYCAMHLPDPRSPAREAAVHDELAALITAAGGRTLALFTSWKAMSAAADAMKTRIDLPVLTQRDLPKAALVKRFADDESASLFATAGFFQGVDIPGRTLSLVVIDRIPFPRPDDPLLSARREILGPAAFGAIDLPRAATLLAQATGRLIRTRTDRGVVAVLDPRLGTASYRWQVVNALPPMKRTRHRAEVEAFLRDVTGSAPTGSATGPATEI